MLTASMTFAFTSDFLFCEQVLLRSRLSSPSMVFRGDPASQDSRSPRALFEACSQTLERIAEEVKNLRTLILALTFFLGISMLSRKNKYIFIDRSQCVLPHRWQVVTVS